MATFGALFPGQGSQSVGMGKFLFDNFASARLLFEEAGDTLSLDFKKLCFEGPESDLALTANTQPALLLVSTCTFKVLSELGPLQVSAAAGHSIGEYAALVAAEVLSFGSALKAVRHRGEAMQSAVPVGQGGMAAVMGLTPEQTAKVCQWAQKAAGQTPLEPANINAPGQIVISGKSSLIEWLQKNFDTAAALPDETVGRVKLIPLKVSAPFHSSMMQPAERQMRTLLEATEFQQPKFPVVQNFSAKAEASPVEIRESLIRQISGSVRWIECMQGLKTMGTRRFIEFGNGKVLAGLAKKIDAEFEVLNINSLDDLKQVEQQL